MFTRLTLLVMCLLVALFVASGPARAGTTGGISGTVVDRSTGKGVAGARVTLTSASQIAKAVTDANGRFAFISLTPDTYTVTLDAPGFSPYAQGGVTITADARQTLTIDLQPAAKVIGRVTSRNSADLVRPGTTADVYSINAGQQDAVSSLGGGGNLDTAYSAIGSAAGAYVPPNQSGYGQAVHIRGGDSDQVGYEFDGIPVNRGFDNAPGGSLSSLGQLELQVYTGATPANAEAQGLAGFVNQVIRSGTYPGFTTLKFDSGDPTFYHSLDFETGGANAARTFSYYVGLGGYNQDFRYIDQFNGASVGPAYGPILYQCPAAPTPALPSCFTNGLPNVGQATNNPQAANPLVNSNPGYVLGSPTWASPQSAASVVSRASVVNLHFAVPHGDGLKDDVQLLYDNNQLYTYLFSSPAEFGAANIANYGYPSYSDSYQYDGPLGSLVSDPSLFAKNIVPYYFPASSPNRPFGGPIPADTRDVQTNGQAIVKLQYQRNIDTTSFLRVYGYTYYSDYLSAGPNSSFQPYTGYDSGDYEVNSHTRGISATYANQLSSRNLIEAQASYTTSTSTRGYNDQMFGNADNFAILVDPASVANPAAFNGVCYAVNGTSAATKVSCSNGSATTASLSAIANGTPPPSIAGVTCNGDPCAYYVAENGAYGDFNHVRPSFSGFSLTDTWKPSDRLTVTAGLRLDEYEYTGDDTVTGPARAFWFAAFNADNCFVPATGQFVDKTSLPTTPSTLPAGGLAGVPCPAPYAAANLVNTPSQQFVYNIFQPRLGSTYTLGPDTVLRASYGKYNEQPSAAYQQYDALQQNLPAALTSFYAYGFNTPGHEVRPEISYNTDVSLEHHFKGTDTSFKLSPFYRNTKDQIQNFYLNVQQGFTSGFNVGSQTSRGFELAVNKGNFARDGFAAQLAFAYTNSYVKYGPLPNGSSILSTVNNDIAAYNAYTRGCAPGGAFAGRLQYGVPMCGATSTGVATAACFSAGGTPDPTCAATSFANPYWNAPVQSLFDPNGEYAPYSNFPGAIGVGYNSFSYPYTTTLILNYRHGRFAVTPNLSFQAGNRYGSPITTPGIDPASGCAPLAGAAVAGDPRYPYGAGGGAPYNAATCNGQLAAIPDPYTGRFDGLGAFREPAQLVGNVRLSYALNRRVEVVATLANVINHCFGGQKTAFTYNLSPQVCSYTNLTNSIAPVGNVYNPGDNVQTFQQYPYEPSYGSYNDVTGVSLLQPFNAYVSVRIKL